MRASQALDIALCLSHGHMFLNFDTTEHTEIWASELLLVVPRRIAMLWQPYERAVCLRRGEIGYRKGG